MVLSNFGLKEDFILNGRKLGEEICKLEDNETEKGSIIIVIATDIPLSDRQLKRVAKRSSVSLARTGSYLGNGSGDIALAFTTANKMPHDQSEEIVKINIINENAIDKVFRATVESEEESILSSMLHSKTTIGRDKNIRKSIYEYL